MVTYKLTKLRHFIELSNKSSRVIMALLTHRLVQRAKLVDSRSLAGKFQKEGFLLAQLCLIARESVFQVCA